jgi:hypothetical protein
MTRRYITSVSVGNQLVITAVCFCFGAVMIQRLKMQTTEGRIFFALIGVGLIMLSIMALRNLCRMVAAILRSMFGR